MSATPAVPAVRVRRAHDAPANPRGDYVLYFMTAARRTSFNYALDRAREHCATLSRPLLVLEALRAGYPYASDRLHSFVLAGMAANAARFRRAGVTCHTYVEPAPGEGHGLLAALASRAAAVVTDHSPAFFLPRLREAAARHTPVLFESVDSCGLLPLHLTPRTFPTAYAFRRFLQSNLKACLAQFPRADPLRGLGGPPAAVPGDVSRRWPAADERLLAGESAALSRLPVDHSVPPVVLPGGEPAARAALARFVTGRLSRYAAERNEPEAEAASGLSPYLHFGHLSPHEVFRRVADAEGFSPENLTRKPDGRRAGFLGLSEGAEAFLDQVLTWRELGHHTAEKEPGYDRYEALPAWARRTLETHAEDPRTPLYDEDDLREARTHDPLWNAAQVQLRTEGTIHNYLRMLWGKKVLQWTESPREAFRILLALNDRYALDGRDPNSVSGVGWCLGRYDRPWGPERPVFGTVRYMSSENTARKVAVERYIARYRPEAPR